MQFYYKVTHKYKLIDHYEKKEIGIYSTLELANDAIEILKNKPGFSSTVEGFIIKKVFRIFAPKLLNMTYWSEGFVTYAYKK